MRHKFLNNVYNLSTAKSETSEEKKEFDLFKQIILFVTSLGSYFSLIGETALLTLKRPPALGLIFKQLYDIGVTSFVVVSITGFSTGLVLAAQSFYQLSDKGLASVTGLMVAASMITELGPILTAFMVTGRVGAAMCAELGTMQVTEQIDALSSMSVNPKRYLIAPRLIAGFFMMPLLTIYSVAMGILGGYLISVYFFHMPPSAYFDPMPQQLTTFDLITGLTKAFIFGFIIMTMACYKGLRTKGGAAGVGRATTSCVVITYCAILIINFFMTVFLNTFEGHILHKLIEVFQ